MDLTPEGRPDWDEQIDYQISPGAKPARAAA
jgi:hypothetical protein